MLNYRTLLNEKTDSWVILIHGAGGSMEQWFRQVSDFSRQHNVLLLDMAGHGNSKEESYGDGFTFVTIAEQVLEVVDHLKITTAHFMGLSLGSIIVREIAEYRPECVKSMLMVGAITHLTPALSLMLKFTDVFKRVLPFKIMKRAFTLILMPQGRYKASKKVCDKSAEKISYDSFVNWISLNKNVAKRLKTLFDTTATIPTVYLTGEDDWLFLKHIKRTVQRAGERASLVLIPNAGHVCNLDNKTFFNKAALDFMSGV